VLLGGWAPGGSRNPAAAGALAYFRWLNAHGGVYGRAVRYRVVDDHDSTRTEPSLVHQLVQGDAVFAIFAVQGSQPPAVTNYLDTAGVPDLFAGWTCACLNARTPMAQVYGWPVNAYREGQILGAYLAQHDPGQKVAIAYSPDTADRSELQGFTTATPDLKVVARTPVRGTSDDTAAVGAAKSARAQALVAFTTPGTTTARLATAMTARHWHAPLVAAGSGTGSGLPEGAVTDGFLPSTAAPARSAARTWITLFSKIKTRYLHNQPLTPALISGMAAAYQMTAAMFRAGPVLTRQGLTSALAGLRPGPQAGLPPSANADHAGAASAYIGIVNGGIINPTGVAVTIHGSKTQVTSTARLWQKAPSDGIPPH
jgi:ABC-type branched-subunit amino acid transport system substrate-binding protein